MALKATIFKADLNLSDLDRHVYTQVPLTLARHPSETDERLMLRLLAYALFADERLQFTKGLSSDDEPDLWLHEDHGEIRLWIELGLPDERRIRKACGRAQQVVVIAYGRRNAPIWWQGIESSLSRFDNLSVLYIEPDQSEALAALAERTMQLQVTLQDGELWLSTATAALTLTPQRWWPRPD